MADESRKPARILGYGRSRSAWRRAVPFVLLGLGLYLLVGCIPIPSTQQFMTNGKLKPSYAIGSGSGSEIRLGYTSLKQALYFLAGRVTDGPAATNATFLDQQVSRYLQQSVPLDHGRRYVISYKRRTGYLVYPLCFMAETQASTDFLALDVDDNDIVIDYHTSHEPGDFGYTPVRRGPHVRQPASLPAQVPPASQP